MGESVKRARANAFQTFLRCFSSPAEKSRESITTLDGCEHFLNNGFP